MTYKRCSQCGAEAHEITETEHLSRVPGMVGCSNPTCDLHYRYYSTVPEVWENRPLEDELHDQMREMISHMMEDLEKSFKMGWASYEFELRCYMLTLPLEKAHEMFNEWVSAQVEEEE